ncbi:MAG TPA: serine/threonine-protein kinase, partial [Gemmataceae bacterium]|nr:serine/threonine-protein kinase [Gemmataceae bacterium]
MNDLKANAKAIFLDALDRQGPDELLRFLDQACGADVDLRARVEELLRAHRDAGNFLGRPDQPEVTRDEPASEGPGTIIGPYKLLEQIGEGGFGIVFMAEQQEPIRRKVALKVLKPGMDTRQVIARFEAERQALALMDHPNIARVLDAGQTASGRPYFVMELVKGVPITDYCDQARLTPRERLELFLAVCHAVQHAHQKGIIHRDLKPSNVLVTLHDGAAVAKIIDFGIAKATGQQLTDKTLFTGFAQLIGTPLYMSPEQAALSGLDVDTRSDIYSLGVLLYELLTGTTPFDKERFKQSAYDEIRRIIREEEPPKPSTRLCESRDTLASISAQRQTEPAKLTKLVRGELDWIVMKCLEKDRNRRYETANGLAMDVQRFLQDETVQACPPSVGYRLRKFAHRNKRSLIAVGFVLGALVVATLVSTWQAILATHAQGLAKIRLEAEKRERERALEAERNAQRRLFDAKLAQAQASRGSRQVGQRFESLNTLREAAELARDLDLGEEAKRALRDEAIACFALADVRLVQPEWQGYPLGSTAGLGFDADLEKYARSDGNGVISVRSVADDQELARLPGPDRYAGAAVIAFSPDGSLLAVLYWRQIPDSPTNFRIWNWRRREVVFQAPFPVATVAFSPDGQHFALAQSDGTITLHQSPRGKEVRRWSVGFGRPRLAFHPDGSQLAISSIDSRKVRIHDPVTGKLVRELEANAGLGRVSWHPDGTLLAAGGRDANVYLWDVATGHSHAVLHGHDTYVPHTVFAASGTLLLSNSGDGTTRIWDPWAGQELLRLPGGEPAVSRDGRRLLIRTGTRLGHWELALSHEYRTLPRAESSHSAAFGPDGRWVLAGGDRGVWLWDMAREGEGVLLPLGRTIDAQFHPRREELFTSGDAGLFRWQAQVRKGVLRIGPSAKCL